MALTDLTYASLRSAVEDWIAREDLTTPQVKDCILMFEAEANRRLRVRQMETTIAITTSSGVSTLPADYLSWRSLRWSGEGGGEMQYVHPTMLRGLYGGYDAGSPRLFTIEGENLTILPTDDSTGYTLHYWEKIPSLESQGDSGTNWLLTAHPDLYLAGSIYCAYKFLHDEGAFYYKQLLDEGIDQIQKLSEKTKGPHSGISIFGATP
jgi:hypothetical protein